MLDRGEHREQLRALLRRHPVVAILGARQVGKTTLARQLAASWPSSTLFDLEDPDDLARLSAPKLALEPLEGLVILDEIQLRPDLFPLLRVLADRPGTPARFLILGSASPHLLERTSETLAGRIHYHRLDGFSLREVGAENWQDLWIRGGFPRSFLADSEATSAEWRRDFVRTFLERDLPQLGITIPGETMRRFWTMMAHYHGQTWNGSELGRALGVSHATVRRYLDLLTSTYVVRQLLPFFENIGKRQVKSPKVYISDTGLLHSLLNLNNHYDVTGHPKVGASWEGFAIAQVVDFLGALPEECFFWSTHNGAEIDLVVSRGLVRRGFEIKYSSGPTTTRSMHNAVADLKLDRLDVIHPGSSHYQLAEKIFAVPIHAFESSLPRFDESLT